MFEANRKGAQVAEFRRTIETHSAAETLELGRQLGEGLSGGEVILLTGELGAGKSVFARGVAQALGIDRWRGSPTFALVHEYASTPALIHVDLYRLAEGDAYDLGLEEYAVPESILLVEWANRDFGYVRALPHAQSVDVHLAHCPGDTRALTITGDAMPAAGRGVC
jgi:tRNA threonylcarbamoyladenosine biosynthesis protein TsaE